MLAQQTTCGIAIASYDGQPISEQGEAAGILSNSYDVHFGLNNEAFNAKVNKRFRGLGPRTLDMTKRGGRTAENTWRWLNHGKIPMYCENSGCRRFVNSLPGALISGMKTDGKFYLVVVGGQFSTTKNSTNATRINCPGCYQSVLVAGYRDMDRQATAGFEVHFAELNAKKPPSHIAYQAGAKISSEDVSGQQKYATIAVNKSQTEGPQGGLQTGVRWSKAALDHVRKEGQGKIHFHLDGMGDIKQLFDKTGPYSHNVTSRELRYVYRNWNEFGAHVIFYNGYTASDVAVVVTTPWSLITF